MWTMWKTQGNLSLSVEHVPANGGFLSRCFGLWYWEWFIHWLIVVYFVRFKLSCQLFYLFWFSHGLEQNLGCALTRLDWHGLQHVRLILLFVWVCFSVRHGLWSKNTSLYVVSPQKQIPSQYSQFLLFPQTSSKYIPLYGSDPPPPPPHHPLSQVSVND